MPTTFNWAHFSDLHLGNGSQKPLWPTFKTQLYRDLRAQTDKMGPLDVVFFTGDFVQTGTLKEFDDAARELETLWREIGDWGGGAPVFIGIPGNHDLERPDESSLVSIALGQWFKEENLRKGFWANSASDCRLGVDRCFKNYTDWLGRLQLPMAKDSKRGLLPGDLRVRIQKAGSILNIIGLNSTFLHIRSGDLKGRLELGVEQLNALCDADPDSWLQEGDLSLLLTHHPVSWLAPEALSAFQGEIYPPDRFFAHLCGHQHVVEMTDISQGGGVPRRTRQAPSLFGLEKFEGNTKRIHGYIVGQFEIGEASIVETMRPRNAVYGLDGSLRLKPDQRFDLNEEGFVTLRIDREGRTPQTVPDIAARTGGSVSEEKSAPVNLLEAPSADSARQKLIGCARFDIRLEHHHAVIRQEEQAEMELGLRKDRLAWIVADWGIDKDGFISSVLSRFKETGKDVPVYHLKCDEAVDIETLQMSFVRQFGVSVSVFGACASVLANQFLLLDGIHPELIGLEGGRRLSGFVKALADYCVDLRIILISRLPAADDMVKPIFLRPLEIPEVRTYVLNHPLAFDALRSANVIEKIHSRSDGLPLHIDELLRAMKVSSISAALDEDFSRSIVLGPHSGAVPPALAHAVNSLYKSSDKNAPRAIKLLKVLTVLPYGEVIESLKHFLPTEPFFVSHALFLKDLMLLEVIPLGWSAPSIKLSSLTTSELGIPKLLKVPRQVRDYVNTLVSDEDRKSILTAGLELYFGRSWRVGKPKLRSVPYEYKAYLDHGLGNEFALIYQLISEAVSQKDQHAISRTGKLVRFYCEHLDEADRYHDLLQVASGFLNLLQQSNDVLLRADLAGYYGGALRMSGSRELGIEYLKSSLEIAGDLYDAKRKAVIWGEIALGYDGLHNSKEAVAAANTVLELVDADSARGIEANWIKVMQEPDSDERTQKLKVLEKSARKKNITTLANNIALNLAAKTSDFSSKIQIYEKVLASDEIGYNRCRAVVAKGQALVRAGKIQQLDLNDRRDLIGSYSYLHTQRVGTLFDSCHKVFWSLLSAEGKTEQLLKLFRHSSFVWRIRGDEKLESEYAQLLSGIDASAASIGAEKDEQDYFLRRVKHLVALFKTPVVGTKPTGSAPNLCG